MNSWFSILRTGNEAVVHIGDDIGCFNQTADDFKRELGDAAEVHLFICSCGGDGQTALEVVEALKGRTTECTISGRCFSAAGILACSAGYIRIERSASYMVHQPRCAVFGEANELREKAEALDHLTENIVAIYSTRCGRTYDSIRRWLNGETYFTAEGAVAAGLCDSIFTARSLSLPSCLMAGTGAPAFVCDESKGKLLLELLRCLGPIQTGDPAGLLRDLRFWALENIREFRSPS